MIEIDNLLFAYQEGEFQLDIPYLRIETGNKVAIVGASGTGKTTLLDLIAGNRIPDRGTIRVDGQKVSAWPDSVRREFRIINIGLVFQEFELIEHLSVLDNILLPFRLTGSLELTADVRERAIRLADEVGIRDKTERNVSHLSQGERQRAAVCRALLPNPDLLLCDEPTGNLDPVNKRIVLEIIFDYVRRTGATLIVVTHDHDLLPGFDRVIDFDEFGGATTPVILDGDHTADIQKGVI